MKRSAMLVAATLCWLQCSAQVNVWTNPGSGRWDSDSWSLGTLPNAAQTVLLTNAGYKAVAVDFATVAQFPESLTVSNLQISAPLMGLSTLLLNYAGTSVPFRITSNCEIMENGTLMNLHSALVLDGANGPPLVQGGSLVQEGGTLTATNASLRTVGGALSFTNAQADFDTLWLGISPFHAASTLHQAGGFIRGSVLVDNASYNLLGGTFSGDLKIGKYTDGFFRQFAGTNRSAILEIGISPFGRGHYTIDGGCLLASSIRVGNAPVGRGWFAQAGGEIEVDFLQIGAGGDYYQASIGNFFLTNGTLRTGRVVVTDGRFVQAGGHHSTAASLSMNGVYHEDRYGLVSMTPKYILEGGTFVSPGIILNAWSIFEQFGGTNFVQGSLSVSNTEYGLHDGCLSTSNTIIDGSGFKQTASFVQKGGNHAVSGTLSILGNYHLSGGTLVSSNILLSGRLVVTAGVLMNAGGVLLMAGELDLRSGSQSLGELQLLDHSLINFGTAPGALHFQVSASRPWKPGKLLAITNWNGQLNGSGS